MARKSPSGGIATKNRKQKPEKGADLTKVKQPKVKKDTERRSSARREPAKPIDLERQLKIQKALYEIADAASAVRDMQSFYKKLHRIVGDLMYAENFIVALVDEDTKLVSMPYFADSAGDEPPPIHSMEIFSKGMAGYVYRRGKPLHASRARIQELSRRQLLQPQGTVAEDWIGVPLQTNDQKLGVLMVQSYKKGIRYADEDAQVLSFVAQHIATALTRARSIEETRQRNAELAIINRVQEGLASKLDFQAIIELVGNKLREIFDAQAINIAQYDTATDLFSSLFTVERGIRRTYEPMHPGPFFHHIINTHEPLIFRTRAAYDAIGSITVPGTDVTLSGIYVPLFQGKEFLGVLALENAEHENAFSEADLRLLQTLANSMSVALENARLFDETQRLLKETDERAAELAIINSVQEGLASKLEFHSIIDLVGDKIRAITEAESVFIALYDKSTELVSWPYWDLEGKRIHIPPEPLTKNITRRVLFATEPLNLGTSQDILAHDAIPPEGYDVGKSFLGVPFAVGDSLLGALSIHAVDQEYAFNDSDVRLLQTLANSMSVALENASLFDELQKRNREINEALEQQTATSEVLRALSGFQPDLRYLLEIIAINVARVCGAEDAHIYRVEGDTLKEWTHRGPIPGLEAGESLPLNRGSIIGRAIVDRQVIHVHDASVDLNETEYPVSTSLQRRWGYRTALATPLLRDGEPIGGIAIRRKSVQPFTEKQIHLVRTFADQAVIAIENVRLFEESQQLLKETEERNAELAVINSVQEGLASKLDMRGIYDLVGDKLSEVTGSEIVMIQIWDTEKETRRDEYVLEKGERFPVWEHSFTELEKSIMLPELQRGRTILWNEGMEKRIRDFGHDHIVVGELPLSVVVVPLKAGKTDQKSFTAISLQNSSREHAFSNSDVRLVETLANSMSVALENARLWEQEKLYRKALQRELEIGREIQAGFLPETLPLIEGWEIAASLMSAREVAGDFYDAFELPDRTIGLVVADVCDKGVGAALFMTLFRSLIRATANMEYFEHTERPESPRSTEDRLLRAMLLTNNYIAETHGGSGMFATVFFGILDPRDGRLLYINGGHEPPLIAEAGVVGASLRKTGPAVGVITDCEFRVAEAHLGRGQTLLAFTDGVPDAQNPRGEFFGRTRLLEVLGQSSGSANALVQSLQRELQQHAAGATQFDDITLLAVTRA